MTPRGKRIVGSAAAAVIGGLMFGSAAQAGLVIDLRFPDGTNQKNVSSAAAGSVFDIEVWLTVTGANQTNTDDGLNAAYFGLVTKSLTPNVTGNLAIGRHPETIFQVPAGALNGAANDVGGSANGYSTVVVDGMKDLAGPKSNGATGFPRIAAGPAGTFVKASDINMSMGANDLPKLPGVALPNGVSFMVGLIPFTLGGVSGDLPADETASLEILPYIPTILSSTRATWLQDGVAVSAATAGTGGYTTGTSVKFSVKSEGPLPFADIDADTLLVDLGTVLRGTTIPTGTVVLSNNGTAAGDYSTQAIGMGDVVSGGAGSIIPGGTSSLVVSLKNASGKPDGVKTGTINVNVPSSDPDGDFSITVKATVGQGAPGQEVKGQIQAGGSYAGIGLSVAPGQGMLGSDAQLLGGTVDGDGAQVSMKWLSRSANDGQLPAKVGLISDILELTTDNDGTIEPFILAMTYDDSLMAGLGEAEAARKGFIFLGWQNADGQWVNAVQGNVGGDAQGPILGLPAVSADVSAMLGQWGVDINSNTVWAVLNHNSRFAVLPEPATFGLLGLGAMGLLARRRRA